MASKKETIIQTLKEEILTLELKPGTIISETMLSERFSLSRTPIRDVLKQLSLAGYIDIYPQRGSIVSYINLESVEQVIFMRSILENEILKKLCGHLSLQGEHRLLYILNQQMECVSPEIDLKSFIKFDDLFHKTIYELAGHAMVWDFIQSSTVHYTRFRHLHMLRKEKLLSIINEHKQIIAHLKKNESYEIDTIIHEHLRSDIKSHYMQKNFGEYIKN
ncbi:GntR family transcriptional regulator [Vallitaleaceae bacterium 9-2]